MRLRLLLTFLMTTTFESVFGGPLPAYPTLSIDDAHLALQRADGSETVFYEIGPSRGVLLDSHGYKFTIPEQLKVDGPNSVQVLVSPDRQYHADWKPKDGKQILDASNLKPLKRSQ